MEEMIDVLDDEGNFLETLPRSIVREKKLNHEGSDVLVFNSKGQLFIQQRAAIKALDPLLWDIINGGWVSSGEDVEESALREIEEELGIKNTKINFLTKILFEADDRKYFGNIFYCIYDREMVFQEIEVAQGKFIELEELEELFKKEKFTPISQYIYNLYKDKIFEIRDNNVR